MPAQIPSVFVRGLPYSLTDEQLEKVFSDVVPVKRAFLVRDPKTRTSRGFGFVQFAFEEDAQTAVAKLNSHEVEGRKMTVAIAEDGKAGGHEGGKPRREPAAKPARAAAAPAEEAPAATAVSGHKRKRVEETAAAGEDDDEATAAAAPAAPAAKTVGKPAAAAAAGKAGGKPVAAAAAKVAAPVADDSDDDGDDEEEEAGGGGGKLGGAGILHAPAPPPYAPCGLRLEQQQQTLAIFGLPADFPLKRLWKRVKKTARPGSIQSVVWPHKLPGNAGLPVAIVTYDRKQARDKAIGKLDGHELHGARLRVRTGENVLAPKLAHLKARLIVRNLRFSATADHIRAAFLRYGASPLITHIHVPMAAPAAGAAAAADSDSSDDDEGSEAEGTGKGEGTDGKPARKPRNRGFAFVEFVSRAEAEVSLNRMTWTPPAAAASAAAAATGATAGDGPRKIHKREVAVDWVVDKEEAAAVAAAKKAAAEAEAAAAAAAATDAASGDEDDADGDDVASGSDVDDEGDDDASDDDEEADAASDDGDGDAASASASGPVYKSEAVEVGTTLFLRNLPFDATDTDVYTAMKVFGPLRYARVVMDRDMGWSKGTAFVQYHTKEGADSALSAASASDAHSATALPAGNVTSRDPRERKRAVIAGAVRSALSDGGVKIGSRVIMISRAVNKDEATKLAGASAGEGGSKRYDKRHLYLQHEGTIRGDSEVGKAMPSGDMAKRDRASADKRTKLKSPFFFVSPTRLSVRNLAAHVDDRMLKELCVTAGIEGMKAGLVDPEEGDPALRLPRAAFETYVEAEEEEEEDDDASEAGDGASYHGSDDDASEAGGEDEDMARGGKGKAAGGKGKGKGGKPARKGAAAAKAPPRSAFPVRVLKAIVMKESLAAAASVKSSRSAPGGRAAVFDAAKGTGASKGFGFVEFSHHTHALAALRQLNNNPAYSRRYAAGGSAAASKPVESRPRLIVEFSVEDWREVKKQERKRELQSQRAKANNAARLEAGEDITPVPSSRSVLSARPGNAGGAPAGAPAAKRPRRDDSAPADARRGDAARDRSASTKPADRRRAKTAAGDDEDEGIASVLRGAGASAGAGAPRGRGAAAGGAGVGAAASATGKGGRGGSSKAGARSGAPAAAPADADARRPAKKREAAQEARHDKLVDEYRKRLFSGAAGGSKADW